MSIGRNLFHTVFLFVQPPHAPPTSLSSHPIETQCSTPATPSPAGPAPLLVLHGGGGGVDGSARPVQSECVHGHFTGAAGREAATLTHTISGRGRRQTHTQGPEGGPTASQTTGAQKAAPRPGVCVIIWLRY